MRLYVTRKEGKNGGSYPCVVLDLGYRSVIVSFDRCLCAELLNIPPAQLDNIKIGEVAEIKLGK